LVEHTLTLLSIFKLAEEWHRVSSFVNVGLLLICFTCTVSVIGHCCTLITFPAMKAVYCKYLKETSRYRRLPAEPDRFLLPEKIKLREAGGFDR
jgi:hypothetical protein